MSDATTPMDHLSLLLDDPDAFRRWCGFVGIEDVPAFLHADVPAAEGGPVQQWGQLQSALKRARRQVNQGDPEAAARTLSGLLDRPGFQASGQATRTQAATLVPAVATRRLPPTARNELVLLGGLGGAAELARRLSRRLRRRVSVRQVRDRLRHTNGVRKLGAGYYAVRYHPAIEVADWAAARIQAHGPTDAEVLVKQILDEYPHGDRRAVNAWIYQGPGDLVVRDRTVHLRNEPAG